MDFDDYQVLRGNAPASPPKKMKPASKKHGSKKDRASTRSNCSDKGKPSDPDLNMSLSDFFDSHQHPSSLSSLSQESQSAAPAPHTQRPPATPKKQRSRQNSFSGMELTLGKFFNQEERLGLSKHQRSCSLDLDDSFHLDDRSIQSAPTVARGDRDSFSAPASPMHRPRRSSRRSQSHERMLPPTSPCPTTPKTPGRKKITRNMSTPSAALKAMVSPLRRGVPRRSFSFGEKSAGIQKPSHRDSFSTASTQSLGSSWSTSCGNGNNSGDVSDWKEWEKSPPKKKSYLKGRYSEENGKEDKKRRTFLKDRVSNVIGKEDAFAMLMLHELNNMDW